MFYEGSLQEGISNAVGQQKLVLCFVTDDSDESKQWETEILPDESVVDLIKTQAVALRLTAGSEEAGYLAQIFPLPRTPTVVIIKNGELKEYITPGTSKEDFINRIRNAFSATSQPSSSSPPKPASSSSDAPETTDAAVASSSTTQDDPASSRTPSTSENVRRILAERAAKVQAQKEEAERKSKEERAKQKAQVKADAGAGADTNNASAHRAAEAVKKRRQQEQEERRRILKRIEDDKAERKLRAAAAKESSQGGNGQEAKLGDVASALASAPKTKLPSTSRPGSGMTALQVRLLDGSTLRSRFATSAPLRDVRRWVDENRTDGTQPYSFKQVLTPLPNRSIDDTEESKAVGELGLSPSSTLVLIPVRHYTSAYDGASVGVFGRFLAFLFSIFSWFLGLFGMGPRSTRGSEQGTPADGESSSSSQTGSEGPGSRNPAGRRRNQQLYNGNSVNFESRPDED